MSQVAKSGKTSPRAKAKRDPEEFATVVREAFLLEHGCTKDDEIAKRIGKSPPQVSGLLTRPGSHESKAIGNLIAPIKNVRSRRRILRAWLSNRFNIDILARSSGRNIRSEPTEWTLERVEEQIQEGQLLMAAATALEAASKTSHRELRERFLDKAYRAREDFGLPGQAIIVARMIADSGRQHGDLRREALGYWNRARTILGMEDSTPSEVWPLIEEFTELMRLVPPMPLPPPKYKLATDDAPAALARLARILFMERGQMPTDKATLLQFVEELQARAAGKTRGSRFPEHYALARVYSLLGDAFLAREHLELAYKLGKKTTPNAFELREIVDARLRLAAGAREEARDQLAHLSFQCRRSYKVSLGRVTEHDLARVESSLFPVVNPHQ